MNQYTFEARDENDTERLGAALAHLVPDGTTIALCGTLGAGKTRLAQTIAVACGVNRDHVTSPTFVLCQEYAGRRTIYHMDAYRVVDEDEFRALGPEEYFESPGVTIIEWADRVPGCLPQERLDVNINVVGDSERLFHVVAHGVGLRSVIEKLKQQLK